MPAMQAIGDRGLRVMSRYLERRQGRARDAFAKLGVEREIAGATDAYRNATATQTGHPYRVTRRRLLSSLVRQVGNRAADSCDSIHTRLRAIMF
jgi:hypothetical protein